MLELLENGIYALPDGRRFIVRAGYCGGYFLHDMRLGVSHPPVYLIDGSGQLLAWGYRTSWRLKDLVITERSSPFGQARLRLVK
jgi:hypothetical protein